MRRHAKAPSAGSTLGTGSSRGLFSRAFATRGAFSDAGGSGAPSAGRRLQLSLLAAVAAFLLVPVAQSAAAGPPAVFTDGASAGPSYTFTLQGRVNPGGAAVASCTFVYGTSAEYGQSAPCTPASLGSGSADVAVTAVTVPLEPDTIYHFRLRASNAEGTGQGKDRTLTTGAAPADSCANAHIRAEQGIEVSMLPDCLALEQVSPSDKANQPAYSPGAFSPDTSRVSFKTVATLGECPNIHGFGGDSFVSIRDSSVAAWKPECVSPPALAGYSFNLYPSSFSPDLSSWLQVVGVPEVPGAFRIYQEGLGGLFNPITSPLLPLNGAANASEPGLLGVSPNRSHVYFAPASVPPSFTRSVSYLAGDPEPTDATTGATSSEDYNLYIAHLGSAGEPVIELAARDRDGKAWGANCGARLGGMEKLTGINLNLKNGNRNQGAISTDGSRIYFSTRPSQPPTGDCTIFPNKKRIMVREETPTGPKIEELIAGECASTPRACPGTATGDIASGSKIVTSFSPSTPAGTFAPGMIVTRIGDTGIAANTKVAQVLSPTELELTAAATITATGISLVANDGDDVYQGASRDQSLVYFTTSRQLLAGDHDGSSAASGTTSGATSCDNETAVSGCDLYLYDANRPVGERLTDVSAGEASATTRGTGASVRNSITAISADGSHAYFVARTVLTTDPNPAGAVALPAENNLYVYSAPSNDLSFVGTLVAADGGSSGIFGGAANWENGAYAVPISPESQLGGDGHILAFRSKAPLTAGDTDSAFDLYRYDAVAGTLQRVSKAAPGGLDNGPLAVVRPSGGSFGTDHADLGRPVSEDGDSIVFITAEPLLPGDTNAVEDTYLWREGQLYHLPGSARPSGRGVIPVLSRDGTAVAYHSSKRLTPSDGDSVTDVYVLRSGGGFPPAPPREDCIGEACQGAPAAAPGDTGAITGSFAGAGNVKPTATRCRKGTRRVRRGGSVRCIRSHRSKKKHSRKHNKKAGAKQGGLK